MRSAARGQVQVDGVGLATWLGHGMRLIAHDMRRRWSLFAVVAVIWVLALVRLFVHHVPMLPLLFNWTDSMPYHVAVVRYGSGSYAKGDLIVYSFAGAEAARLPGLAGQPLFKQIAGVAGDVISLQGRDVFLNGAYVGSAKAHTFDHRPLAPIEPGRIPEGFFYVRGMSPDSFDSRYASSGLVPRGAVRAKVIPIL
jgi:conjugal transfer pilin signal peptidase TrbI